ncbi:putative protein phosphatase 2C 80-like [Hibiscus syriacus]|uniref:Uncharacterized protein n=1 Tax=Hibiscus syriacus TaxID=106335 RepID=A0A6A2WEY5_HIBSY|nr:putative protein phosphatase 2C 80-like [Hibiscus syriacus]
MDWDSIMKDLGLDDELVPSIKTIPPRAISPSCENRIQNLTEFASNEMTHQFNNLYEFYSGLNQNPVHQSDFNAGTITNNYLDISNSCGFHNISNFNLGFDFIEDLVRAADCFDTHELQFAQVIFAWLSQRLQSPSGKPLQRAAFYFKEALQSLLNGSTRSTHLSSWNEIVQTIKAYKDFCGINPIPMFSQFSTNQALLEALDGSGPLIHIIDFDIGLGGQYASLIREMTERNDHSGKFILITAVVSQEYAIETRLIKDSLVQFAQDLKKEFLQRFGVLRRDVRVIGRGLGERGMGQEDRYVVVADQDIGGSEYGGDEYGSPVEGEVSNGGDEDGAFESVGGVSGRVAVREGVGPGIPRGKRAGRVGALLVRERLGCHVGLEVLSK